MEVGYIMALNILFLGIIAILFKSAKSLHAEVQHLKRFTSMVLSYTEETTGKTPEEIKNGLNKYIEKYVDEMKG